MKVIPSALWIGRFLLLLFLHFVFFLLGSFFVSGFIPDITSEPGLVSQNSALFIISATITILVIALVQTSRWRGWKLALLLGFSYYGVVTFVMQIETWYFLSSITVGPELLPRLFMMGLPVAFGYIPLAVWILNQKKEELTSRFNISITQSKLVWKLSAIALAYLILYWCAGYFIAWQNPSLRTFYTNTSEIQPFWDHTLNTLKSDPWLFPFQIFRAMLWTLFALPVILGSRVSTGWTSLLVALLFSVPQNIGHIMENPLLPIASVRFSHMIETASSTFLFGLFVVWILQPKQVERVA
jgi:hypothetical protein